jgi:hypothetical protein
MTKSGKPENLLDVLTQEYVILGDCRLDKIT